MQLKVTQEEFYRFPERTIILHLILNQSINCITKSPIFSIFHFFSICHAVYFLPNKNKQKEFYIFRSWTLANMKNIKVTWKLVKNKFKIIQEPFITYCIRTTCIRVHTSIYYMYIVHVTTNTEKYGSCELQKIKILIRPLDTNYYNHPCVALYAWKNVHRTVSFITDFLIRTFTDEISEYFWSQ